MEAPIKAAPAAVATPAAPSPAPPSPQPAPVRAPRGSPARRRQRRTLRYVLIEVAIVTAGVLVALGVEELRTSFDHRRSAEEARERFRTELAENRARAVRKLAETERVYRVVQAEPERAASLVRNGENLFMLLFDSGWVSAVQTGALRHLDPAEVGALSSTYSGQERYMRLQEQEQERWQGLGAFGDGPLAGPAGEAQTAAVAQWLSYARGLYQSTCRLVFRYDQALGQGYAQSDFDRCRRLDPVESYRPPPPRPR